MPDALTNALDDGGVEKLLEAVRPDLIEHLWAEPFNDRTNWQAVRDGYEIGSPGHRWLNEVYGGGRKDLWSRYAAELYQRLQNQAVGDGWRPKLRYLLYEGGIVKADAGVFSGLEGVLLQSKPDEDGNSKNPHIGAMQAAVKSEEAFSASILHMEHVDRFFGPFGASEMFISALLGWGVQVSEKARGRFLDAVEAKAATSCDETQVRATLAALADAEDLTVTVETYTTAGNADLALFSRAKNAVLVVEHKTGSSLSRWQITKYRLAMIAADPRGDRKLATVLLRPPTNPATDKDMRADPGGVAVSVELNHNPHLSRVFAAIASELDSEVLGDRIIGAAVRQSFPTRGEEPTGSTDNRKALLDELEELLLETDWRVGHRRSLSMDLIHDAISCGHLYVTIGPHERSMLWGQFRPDGVRIREFGSGKAPSHLFDLCPGSRSVSFPTPFPVHHTEKPWMGDRAEERAQQVRVAGALLSVLPTYLLAK